VRKNILLIEGNVGDAVLLQEAFDCVVIDHHIDVVTDGERALGALLNYAQLNVGDHPNLVLLDLDLPGLDGKMVLRSIRNKYALRSLPAIVLSSSSSATDIADAYDLNADAYDLNADAYDLNANAYIVKPQEISGYLDMVKTLSAFWLNLAQLPTDLHHAAFL
jgi:CheY-like chemotaxis protein